MLIPVGLDETRLARWPWVTTAILAACVLVFLGQAFSSAGDEVERAAGALATYWAVHPDLEAPEGLAERTGLDPEDLLAAAGDRRPAVEARPGTGDPAHLADLGEALAAALEATPERAYGLVPARGAAQPGWLTYQFLHGSLGHLLGNMLVFLLVVAPFLEDAWGRPFFLGLFLAGGVVAGLAQALPDPSSAVPVIGASGAISACLGAFALRFAHRRVRLFYWFFLFLRGTFFVPAWAYACFGFAMDLWALSLDGASGGVAYGAHVGGFLFGLAVAGLVKAGGLEERLAPAGAARWGASLEASRASDRLAAGDLAGARHHLEAAAAAPGDDASLLALARLEASRYDRDRTAELTERLVARRLQARDPAGARAALVELGPWLEPRRFQPATAYRAAELLAGADEALADRFDEVAATAGGALGLKALLRLAERCRRTDPGRARAHLTRALELPAPLPELRARAEALLASLPRELPGDRSIELG